MIIGGYSSDSTQYGGYLSDIEAVSIDGDNVNCDPTDLPYKVDSHSSVYSSVLAAIVTCGGVDDNYNFLSKCILQGKGNESNQFPSLNSRRCSLTLTFISRD